MSIAEQLLELFETQDPVSEQTSYYIDGLLAECGDCCVTSMILGNTCGFEFKDNSRIFIDFYNDHVSMYWRIG